MLDDLEQQYQGTGNKAPRPAGVSLTQAKLREKLSEVEKQASDPNLWSNPARSQLVMRERKRLEDMLSTDTELTRREGDIRRLF